MEQKFCDLSEFVSFLKLQQLIKFIDMFKLNWDDFARPFRFKLVKTRMFEANMAFRVSF